MIDSLFELADTWCPSINEAEYAEFFKLLRQQMEYSANRDENAYDLI